MKNLAIILLTLLGLSASAQSINVPLGDGTIQPILYDAIKTANDGTDILIFTDSDNVNGVDELVVRYIMSNADGTTEFDNVSKGQDGEDVTEHVRAYIMIEGDYIFTVFVADAEGYLQEVMLTRKPRTNVG